MKLSNRYCSRFIFLSVSIAFGSSPLFTQPKTITILHTNDIHASAFPHKAFWMKETPKPLIGGFKELSYAVDSIRQVKSVTLMLDAGDIMTGNPITEYEYKGASGGALFEMMNLVGYDAWEPGNHDFDISVDNLKKLTTIAHFPTTSANILDTLLRHPINNLKYCIIEKGGIKIGIIGLISTDFHSLVNKSSGKSIKILSPIETIQHIVDTIGSQTDLLIALTHQGVDVDSVLAMNVKGLNVIVGGHSHTRLWHPKIVNGVVIVQTGSNCENLGILDITVEKHRVIKYEGSLLPLWYNPTRVITPLSMFIDSMKNKIDSDYEIVLAELKNDWINSLNENPMGHFIADAQREAVGADIGFMNTRGIRKNISAGPITKHDLFEIFPFRNMLMKFELNGRQIRSIVEYYINEHSSIQISGIKCEWKRRLDGSIQFVNFLINGKPLDESKVYLGAASDYVVGEAKNYLNIDILNPINTHQTVFAAVEKKIIETKEIQSVIEQRISQIK